MAAKAITPLFTILALFLLLSTAAESRNVTPELSSECYNAIFKAPTCLFEIIGAAGRGGSSAQISAPCCNAFLTLTRDCQFQISFSGNLLPVIQKSCGAAVGGPSDGGGSSPPAPPTPLGPAAAPV